MMQMSAYVPEVIQLEEKSDKKYRTLKRDTRWVIVLIFVLLFLFAVLLLCALCLLKPSSVVGTRILPMNDMTTEEAQAFVDEQAEKSRITVSLQPSPAYDEESSTLYINFVVMPENNGFSERFEITQDGNVIYKSEVVDPGYQLASVEAPNVHSGEAVVTVYAVDEQRVDQGNPVSVEIEVQ